jgi:hypothetical protein
MERGSDGLFPERRSQAGPSQEEDPCEHATSLTPLSRDSLSEVPRYFMGESKRE